MKPLNIYIHIPFCFAKCPYCAFFSCTNCESEYENYFQSLNKEITSNSKKYKDREIETIYIGGGTPNLVPTQYITQLIENIKKNFNISPDIEITIELYPQYITKEALEEYQKVGINRLSLGLQSASNEDLNLLSRRYTFEEFKEKYELAKNLGFKDIGIDLIFGYPGHTLDKWKKTLNKVIDLDIQHISCYSLEIEEGTPYGKLYEVDKLNLPTEKENRDMYHYTCEYLEENGFKQYEISNFSKPGYECKHNLNFWNYEDYLGLGAGAYSRVDNVKFNNPESVEEYIDNKMGINMEAIDEELKKKEQLILGLRLNKGVMYDEKYFDSEYMEKEENRMVLNEKGRDFYNTVISNIL